MASSAPSLCVLISVGDGAIQLLATGMHSAATQEAGAAGVGAKQLPKISLRSSETQLEASLIVPVLIAAFYFIT